jgi:hypothetical protein
MGARSAQVIWLMRRAAILAGASPGGFGGPPDPSRAALFYRVAARLGNALDTGRGFAPTAEERAALAADAQELTEAAAREVRRPPPRDLAPSAEGLRIAQALREVAQLVEARPPAPTPPNELADIRPDRAARVTSLGS